MMSSLELHWQPQTDGDVQVVELATEFAVLQLSLSGRVIYESNWLLRPNEPHKVVPAYFQPLKQYLESPVCITFPLTLLSQGTEFSRRVWLELLKIPYGETISYAELAKRIGSGARAVANACRNNPFPGIIPCHRVVSVNGIGGFMGQSHGEFVELKRKILQYEAAKRQSTRRV